VATQITKLSNRALVDMYVEWHKKHFGAEISANLEQSLACDPPESSILATHTRARLEVHK